MFSLRNNLELTVANNSYVNLNNNQNLAGVVFQKADSSNANSLGYISGTYLDNREDRYGFTAEANIIFPWFAASDEIVDRNYISSSLFGMCEANTSSADNTAFLSTDNANFQIHAVRDRVWSKNVYFRLSSSNSPFPFPELTSSTYFDVYNNNQWHFSVRLKPSNYPITDMVTGSDTFNYMLEFRGVNAVNETIQNTFKLTASVDQATGANFLKSAKRMYAGAQRTNVTGALVNRSDANITNLKYWSSYLNDNNLDQHLYDINNAGISGSYKSLSPLDPLLKQVDAVGANTLGLHWTFDNVTGSDSSGNFYYVSDMSSGSSELRDNYGWIGAIGGYQHTGYGYGFKTNSSDVVKTEPYNTLKFIDPEAAVSSEMISIVGEEEVLYGIAQSPPKYYHVVEKSMYQAISEEMLTFFAGVIDFNNVIGEPVNRYRGRYKALEKLREVFFRKVTETSKVEKFIEYYRWLDDAIAIIVSQLMPASAGFIDDAYNIVESHVLERNKYRAQFPTIEFVSPEPEFPIMGINEMLYNWRVEHAPASNKQNEAANWWLLRADRLLNKQITSGDTDVDRQREVIRETAHSVNAQTSSALVTAAKATYQGSVDVLRTLARPYKYAVTRSQVLKGGVNFQDNKNIAFTYNALRPDGPVNTEGGVFVPLNVMVAFTDDLVKEPDSIDNLELKTKTRKYFGVQHGRDYQDGFGYSNVKSSYAFPFNILSSSVATGYNKQVVDKVSGNIEITNVHNDVYGEDMEVPLQGPFSSYAVGGHQSRHVAINKGTDTYLNRPEAWKILLDTCTAVNGVDGGIGMTGPDYPWPESNTKQISVSTTTGDYLNNTKGIHWPDTGDQVGDCLVIPSIASSIYQPAAYNLLFDNNMTGSGTFPTWTFSAWINPSASNAYRTIWAAGTANASGGPIHTIGIGMHEELHYTFRSSQNVGAGNVRVVEWETANNAITNGSWQHIAVSLTGTVGSLSTTALPTLYVNGVSQSWDGATSPSATPYDHLPNARNLKSNVRSHAVLDLYGTVMIGGNIVNAGQKEYQGSMDEVAIWNRKLTDLEVAQVYNSGSPCVLTSSSSPQSASLAGWWRLGDASGDAINTGATAPDAISGANVIYDLISSASFLPTAKAGTNTNLSISTDRILTGCDNRVYTTRLVGPQPYPMTGSERAVYYRDFTAKTPYVFKNILMRTGSTILGNYQHNYQIVSTVGAYANPRAFVENPPVLPTEVTQTPAATQGRTILSIRRTDENHFEFTPAYAVPYFHDTSSANKSVIRQRFSSPGGIETIGQGYGDIRSDEYSVYNTCNYKNLTLLRPFQNMSGTVSEATGAGTPGIRAVDINGQDFGLRFNLTQHAGRFGRNSLLVTNPGASYDQQASLVKDNRNPLRVIKQTDEGAYYTASQYDNFWVQHQIPRSDRQYAWVTNSLAYESLHGGLRYWGYAPTHGVSEGMYSSSATGYTSYFGFVTASSVLGHAGTASIYQPALNLNIYVAEPVDVAGDNTLGFSTTASVLSYYNAVSLSGAASGPIQSNLNLDADFFNLVMTQRKSTFGYRGNPQTGPVAPTVLRRHRRQNTYSFVFNETTGIEQYTILPISNRSQPMLLNLDIEGNNETLQQSYNLEHSYFGNEDLDQKLVPNLGSTTVTTAGETIALARSSDSYNLNWIIYRETLFPAAKNQFLSSSSTRVGYDNLYWRNSELARYRLTTTANLTNSYGTVASQSCWPLDAPLGFLTRSNVPMWTAGGSSAADRFIRLNSAGELQNEYIQATPIADNSAIAMNRRLMALRIAGLYSRKHMLGSPFSVVAPSGMHIPQTGAVSVNSRDAPFEAQIQLYAGSALWEAASQAGIVTPQKVGTMRATVPSFQTASSQPWFSNYADFEDELGRISKGFAIVPEFRISEHMEDYQKYGIDSPKKYDTFEIVGTVSDSANTSFYKDFSNSDFMSSFADIHDMSLLDPTQILLTCTASIRLNPYKGFYPAQRTTDLIKRFADSYGQEVLTEAGGPAKDLSTIGTKEGSARPVASALFAPGILYNTIKAGIAVDYPIISAGDKAEKTWFGHNQKAKGGNLWMLTSVTGAANGRPSAPEEAYLTGGLFWDNRFPFESIITPTKYLNNIRICDLEPHPSCSLDATASLGDGASDPLYTKMASNFFGEIGNFFLKDSGYTKLESGLVRPDLRFATGSIYGARVKLRRTMSGSRIYSFESGSSGDNRAYSKFGAKYFDASTNLSVTGTSYPLPQDPRQIRQNHYGASSIRDQHLQENFTLYSRPSAFGPPAAARPGQLAASNAITALVSPADGTVGFNWAYTPPYYHGEAWADLIFTPDHTETYDLEKILSEVKTVYWRCDPGPSSSVGTGSANFSGTQLLPTFSGNFSASGDMIYDGKNINGNSMQLSASLDMFGVEPVFKIETDAHGDFLRETNEVVGKRWVIQPKMETPHFNFNDTGAHPISEDYGTLSAPLYGSGSVPRGMWHQFGIIEPSGSKGIFMEIQDIPKDWLKYHYDVRTNDSVYNKNNASLNGRNVANNMKSLTDIGNFQEQSTSARLGELASNRTIKEAIVAVPYIQQPGSATERTPKKEFFEVSQAMVDASSTEAYGTTTGDSTDFAGESVRKLVQKMQDYILPPQFDFLNNPSISPMVMYFFEFAYSFDKDDLSYIWQNLAPRDYKKMKIEVSSTGHKLSENELLSPEDVLRDNVRWMVFKVKQRSQKTYDDLRIDQAGQASTIKTPKAVAAGAPTRARDESYPLQYNWPYDYVSFVESIKFGASVQYAPPPSLSISVGAPSVAASVAAATGIPEAYVSDAMATPGVDSALYDAVASTGTAGATEMISVLKEVTPGELDIEEVRRATPATPAAAPTSGTRSASPAPSTTGTKKF